MLNKCPKCFSQMVVIDNDYMKMVITFECPNCRRVMFLSRKQLESGTIDSKEAVEQFIFIRSKFDLLVEP